LDVGSPEAIALFFVWTVGVCLFYCVSRKWAKIFQGSILLLLAPLIIFKDRMTLVFILITVLMLCIYIERLLHKGSRSEYVSNFKKAIILFIVALYLRWILPNLGKAIALAAPYIFVYCLSTILMIRSCRHIEAGMDIKRLQRTNIRYLLFIAVVFLLTAVKQVRQFLVLAAKKFLALLLLPWQLLLRLFEWLNDILISLETKGPSEPWLFPESPDPEKIPAPPPTDVAEEVIASSPIYDKILIALLVAIGIFILYKILVKTGERSYKGLDYIEEREYIKKKKQRRQRRFLFRNKLPAEPGEQVRYYYRKFLEKLVTKKVELTQADTSLEIQEKAEIVYPQGPEEIRAIYIASRYGEKEADSAAVAQIEHLYKDL
jgi:hypothetical protein